VGWHLIWNLHVNHVTKNLGTTLSTISIHNQWLIAINSALKRDQILTQIWHTCSEEAAGVEHLEWPA
jgi:hypothetical protein